MNEHLEPDPLDALRAADPVDADRLSSASLARIRARVNEDVMTTPTRRLPWGKRTLGLGAGVAAIAALALVVALGGGSPAPGVTPGGSIGTGSASCVEPYSKIAITHRTFAFDGTVSAINGEQVTFSLLLILAINWHVKSIDCRKQLKWRLFAERLLATAKVASAIRREYANYQNLH